MEREAEVSVRSIGSGGFGIGELPDGKVVFLPRTAPGDRVLVRIVKEKARWARGEVLKRMEDGEGRCEAPCPMYSRCDGCSLQHISYEEQLRWKGRFVGDALRRVGGIHADDPLVSPSPLELRYRNKVTFTLRRLLGGRIVAGFRELGHQGRVLDVGSACLLPEDPIMEAWAGLRVHWGAGASLLPAGKELRITLRNGPEGVALTFRGGRGRGDPEALLALLPGVVSIWEERRADAPRHLAGEKSHQLQWGEELLTLPGAGFVQVNRSAGEALQEYVLGEAGAVEDKTIIDAYCGAGVVGRAMARKGARVVGIDLDPAALGIRSSLETEGFRAVSGRVEEHLDDLLPADLVLLNPPRSGLAESIPPVLTGSGPERVIYVSCDPATLARDLKRLEDSYEVERVRSFDLFPQTAHVETVVTLRARNGYNS